MNALVTAAWLAERWNDPQTVVADATLPPVGIAPAVDTRARYQAEHIPGAVFFDIDALSDHSTTLPHMLPTPNAFAHAMSALGIGSDMTVIVYEQEGVFSAPRAWWMLRTFGAPSVHVLDGGLRAWREAGLPVESGNVKRPPASFKAAFNREAVKGIEEIRQMIANREHTRPQILDARSSGRFTGAVPEPRAGLRSGHMPGSTSLPFTELTQDGRMQSAHALRELFSARQIDIDQPITTTCGSGVTAAVIALALDTLGAKHVSLYDGSWAEYAQQPDALIEKGT